MAAELYDPSLGTWATTGSPTRMFGGGFSTTLLSNGKVLIAGGASNISGANLYDPQTGTWSATGAPIGGQQQHAAVVLANGQVLVAGGTDGTTGAATAKAQLYDPSTGAWSLTGSMGTARNSNAMALLPSGKVLVAGGSPGAGLTTFSSAEIYDPAAGTWSPTGSMANSRIEFTLTVLADGTVLAAGGTNFTSNFALAELYDSTTGTWSTTGSMNVPRVAASATLLPNGEVLVAGGDNATSAELYTPGTAQAISTTATLTSNINPSVFGQPIVLTATVVAGPGTGTPTGSVQLLDAATTIGSTKLDASGLATFTTTGLAMGTHSLTAVYSGDANFSGSTAPALSQVVNQAATAVSLIADANPTPQGQTVTLTATLTVSPPGSGTPSGSINFEDGATMLGTVTLSAAETATLAVSTLSPGSHSIIAVYTGDANFAGSSSPPLLERVTSATTSTSLASDVNPSVFGQSVTLRAAVVISAGVGTVTGNVTFVDGSITIGTAMLDQSGVAILTTAALSVGQHSLSAIYSGAVGVAGSTSSTLTQVVNRASSPVSLTADLNPIRQGQTVTFTATLSVPPPGSGTPTGTVAFYDGATTLGLVTLDASLKAALAVSSLVPGTHSITSSYTGDANFVGASSDILLETVNVAIPTTLTVQPDVNPTRFGQAVTLTALLTATGATNATPSGMVSFFDGQALLGRAPVSSTSKAVFLVSSLGTGAHSITATYGGDSTFVPSTSSAYNQVVQQAATTVVLASGTNPSVDGQSIPLTATIAFVAPGGGIPTGTVSFADNGSTALGNASLNADGKSTLAVATLGVGIHQLSATYMGDSNFTSSSSSPITQTVAASSPTLTSLTSSANPSILSQMITLSASVSQAIGPATPVGQVSFLDGAAPVGTANLDASGKATLSIATLALGRHDLSASFLGSVGFNSSTSAVLTQAVNATGPSTTLLSSSSNPSTFGQPLTVTASVDAQAAGLGPATGQITFKDGTISLATVQLNGIAQATLTTNTLLVATHDIVGVYSGDAHFDPSTSLSLKQVITPAAVLDITSPAQTIQAGAVTTPISLQLEDLGGHPIPAGPSGLVVHLTSSSPFGTFRDAGNSVGLTTITIPAGSSAAGFFYGDTFAGTPTLTAAADPAAGVAAASQVETVTGGPLDHLRLSPDQATVALGRGRAYTAKGFDAFGNDLGDVTPSTTFAISPDGACTANRCVVPTVGSHTVSGRSGAATGTAVLIGDSAPMPRLVVQNPAGIAPHAVTFLNSATYSGTQPLTYQLQFGDGSSTSGALPSGPVTHTYTSACPRCVVVLSVSDGIASPVPNTVATVDIAPNVPLLAAPGDAQTVVLGTVAHLDGSNSTPPPPAIINYHWDFGDGTAGDGPVQDHVYPGPAPKDWTATLTVSGPGSSASASVVVHVIPPPAIPGLTIHVSGAGQPLAGATVVVEDAQNNIFPAADIGGGSYHISGLNDGSYGVYGYAPGFIPGATVATLSRGSGTATLNLESGAVAMTDLTTQRLTAQQAIALGIDPTLPGNQNIYQFELHLAFIPGQPLDFTGIVSSNRFTATCSNCGGGWSPAGGFTRGGSFNLFANVVFVKDQPMIIWMIIPGQAKWLKEFFSVRLLITNLAPAPFVLTKGTAFLDLPGGLSLAELSPGLPPQSVFHTLPDIPGGGSQSTEWLIRGDAEGFYPLSAEYFAALQPVGASVHLHAETNAANQIHVWGASALRMTVDADDWAYANLPTSYPYHIRVSLTNVADVPVYNPAIELKPLPDSDPRRNYLFQPGEQFVQTAARINPGGMFTARDYIVAPSFQGRLDLSQSFVLRTGGNVFVPSRIVSHAATPPSAVPKLEAARQGLTTQLTWQAIPGAYSYQIFTTPNFHQSFPDIPLLEVKGTTALLPPAPDGEVAVSTVFRAADGTLHNVLLHNLTSAQESAATVLRVTLTPIASTVTTGSSPVLTARVTFGGGPIPGIAVTLRVTGGPTAGQTFSGTTDSNGQAKFGVTSTTDGTDLLQAGIPAQGGNEQTSNTAQITFLQQDPAAPQHVVVMPDNSRINVTWQPPLVNPSQVMSYTIIAKPVDEGVHLDPPSTARTVTRTVPATTNQAQLTNLMADCHQVYAITVRANTVGGVGFSSTPDDDTTVRPSGILPNNGDPPMVVVTLDGFNSTEPASFVLLDAANRGQSPGTKFASGISYCPEDLMGQPTTFAAGPLGDTIFGDGMNRFMSKWNFEESTPVSRINGSQTNRFMLDSLAASGAVILPYSYKGANLHHTADGRAQFSYSGYSVPDSIVGSIPDWVDELQKEVSSIHETWPSTRIVIMGHSQGGLLAEQYWERKIHDRLADGVLRIYSFDAPVNGFALVPSWLGIVVRGFYGQLWGLNYDSSGTQGLRDAALSQLDGRTGNIYRPVGNRLDPLYSSKWPGLHLDGADPGILSQILLTSKSSCDSADNCLTPPPLPPSQVGPHVCDVTQADVDRQFVKYDGGTGTNPSHHVVKYCPSVVAFVVATSRGGVRPVPAGPPVVALGNSLIGPPTLAVGGRVRVTGFGFKPGSPVIVSVGSVNLGALLVDNSGWMDGVLTLPSQLGPGRYDVAALGTGFDGLERLVGSLTLQ